MDFMSEKRLNNTLFLMYLVTENYRKKYGLSHAGVFAVG